MKKINKYEESCYFNNLSKVPLLRRLLIKQMSDYKMPFKPFDNNQPWESLVIELYSAFINFLNQKNILKELQEIGLCSSRWNFQLYQEESFAFLWRSTGKESTVGFFNIEYFVDFLPIFKYVEDKQNLRLKRTKFMNSKFSSMNVAALTLLFSKFIGDFAPVKLSIHERGTEPWESLYHQNVFVIPYSYGLYKKYTILSDLNLEKEILKVKLKESKLDKPGSEKKFNYSNMVLEWYMKNSPFNSKKYLKELEETFYV